jgi:hypothetical protein
MAIRLFNRDCLWKHIDDTGMRINNYGKIIERCWFQIPGHFPEVDG